RPAGRFLVPKQRLLSDDPTWNAGELILDTGLPRFIECHTGNGCNQIDPVRRKSKLHNVVLPLEVAGAYADAAEAELGEGRDNASRIFRRRTDQDVQVAGVARKTVVRDREA